MSQSEWLDDEQSIQRMVMEGVDVRVRNLIDRLRIIESGLVLATFLNTHADTLMTVEDAAYLVHRRNVETERDLFALVDLGVAQLVDVGGLLFFGLTADREQRQVLCELCAWQDRWRTYMARIKDVIDGT